MSKVSIHIQIGDRTYPMKVEVGEVERIKKCSKILNLRIKDYQKKFGLDDIQDLLAMVAFDALISEHRSSTFLGSTNQKLGEKISTLHSLIDALKLED